MKGLFNKIKNRLTRQRFVVSTICKGPDLFETAVFRTNFFYLRISWSNPDLTLQTHDKDEAWDNHYRLTASLTTEYPAAVFKEYC
jgi:hypothetical protein